MKHMVDRILNNAICLIIALTCFTCTSAHAQDISGLWKGEVDNGLGITVHYELAITSLGLNKNYAYLRLSWVKDGKLAMVVQKMRVMKINGYVHVFRVPEVVLKIGDIADGDYLNLKTFNRLKIGRNKQIQLQIDPWRISGSSAPSSAKNVKRKDGYQVSVVKNQMQNITTANGIASSSLMRILNEMNLSNSLSFLKKIPRQAAQADSSNEILVDVPKRKMDIMRVIDVSSDTISIQLFDNGQIDGDYVSVMVNGQKLVHNQLLGTRAVNLKFLMSEMKNDSATIVLVADNLGSMSPNTGLAVIYDNDTRHEVGFSGDLTRSATIILTRRKAITTLPSNELK